MMRTALGTVYKLLFYFIFSTLTIILKQVILIFFFTYIHVCALAASPWNFFYKMMFYMFVSRNLKSVMWQTIICTFTCRCIRTIYNKSSFISIKLNCQSIPELNTLGSNMPIIKTFSYQKLSKVTTYWKTCKHELGLSALEIHY